VKKRERESGADHPRPQHHHLLHTKEWGKLIGKKEKENAGSSTHTRETSHASTASSA
jgi:hypothetical protein